MRIENREALNQLEEYAKQVIGVSKCRILICAGTGCLAGGSGQIYEKMCELVKGYPDVSVEFGPEIAHGCVLSRWVSYIRRCPWMTVRLFLREPSKKEM